MNDKIAKVIAVELGMLIVIGTWLAVAKVPGVIPGSPKPPQVRAAGSFAAVSRGHQPQQQRVPDAVDYLADQDAIQPLQYEEQAPTLAAYQPQGGAEPYVPNDFVDQVAYDSQDYVGVIPEPVLTSPDCFGSPYGQGVIYPQTTRFVVYSDVRAGTNRRQARPHCLRPRRIAMQPRSDGPRQDGRINHRGNVPPRQHAQSPGAGAAPRPNAQPRVSRPRASQPATRVARPRLDP